MWEVVIIDALILFVGFLVGVMVGDGASENKQMEGMRKELNKLRRQIEVMRRQNNE